MWPSDGVALCGCGSLFLVWVWLGIIRAAQHRLAATVSRLASPDDVVRRTLIIPDQTHTKKTPTATEGHTVYYIATHSRTGPPYTHLFCFVWFSPLFCGLYPLPLVVRTLPSP